MKYYVLFYQRKYDKSGNVGWYLGYNTPQHIREKQYYNLSNSRWILSKCRELSSNFHYYSYEIQCEISI
jgi:hypothetical protein